MPGCNSFHELCLCEARGSQERPLLVRMATEPLFLEPLARFERRACYSNLVNDLQVPYCTGAIRGTCPFGETRLPAFLDAFSCVAPEPDLVAEEPFEAFEGDPMRAELCESVKELSKLGWSRFSVEFRGGLSASFRAHEWICGKNAGAQMDVPRHVHFIMQSAP